MQSKKHNNKEKGKKGAGVATVSMGKEIKPYMPVKLPLSREAHIETILVGLEAINNILPSPLWADSMQPLVATLAIFETTLDSNSIVLKDNKQVTKAGD